MKPIETRVGVILEHDNRFFGRSAFDDWMNEVQAPSDLVATALGVTVDDTTRELWRVVAVSLTSPDARVWPLKLTRILASHGDAAAAFFAAQLVNTGKTMGPGTVAGAAALLSTWTALDAAGRSAQLTAWKTAAASDGKLRLPGFGVPFRAEDERLVGMRRVVDPTPAARRPHWRAMGELIAGVATVSSVKPNVAIGVAAVLLDCGVRPALCGLGLSMLMAHVFLGHAVEAIDTDAALQTLPTSFVRYVGPAPRSSVPSTG